MDLLPNFQVGLANGDGDCFFDSVAQGLKQLRPELDFTVKSLRLVCKTFAQNGREDEQPWLIEALKGENEQVNEYISRVEFSAKDFHQKSEAVNNMGLTSPVWGRSEIEGRIICAEYDVKLHVVKKHIVEGKEIWTHQIVDSEGSRSLDTLDYKNDENTLHVVNKGDLHFGPILKIKAVQQNKLRFSDPSDDGDEVDVQITAGEELLYAIKSNDSETRKVTRVKELFKRASNLDINFQGINNDTCLHVAVRKKELKVIEFLVKKGARTDIKNDKNRSPLDVAKRLERQDILKMLQPDIQKISVEEQKERNQKSDDERNKKSKQVNVISCLSNDELPSEKYIYINLYKDDQTTEGKYNELTYEKRPETTGMHGQLYEINLIMLLLLQAEAKEKVKKINSFYLATNMQGVGAFDDVVFKYKYSEDRVEKSKIIFLQAKHKEAEKEKTFTIENLFSKSEKGDFPLRKYLDSYIKITQLRFKEDHPLFLDGIDRSDFVIYTNSAWNFESQKDHVKKENVELEDALHFEENPKRYYYQLNANEIVKKVLRPSLDFEVLVRELTQSVYSGSIESSKHIFKDYHVFLADRVLQISETNKEEGQLRLDFLDGTQDAEFSRAFLAAVRNNKNFSSTFSANSDNELKEKLRNKIIKVPKNFGRAQDNELNLPLPNKTIPDETIEEFLKKLKLFTDQPNVNDLEILIKNMIINVFGIEEKDANLVYCDVYSKITKWWREQEKVAYLTEHRKLFNNAKGNLWNMHLVGLAILYDKRFKSLGLSFESNHIERLSNLIRKNRILRVVNEGDAVLLSTVKVYQAIEGMAEFRSKDSNYKYIFLSLTAALELKNKVLGALKSERRDLLVIECEGTETNFEEFYVHLKNIVKLNKCKKIVLTTRRNDSFGEQFKRDFSMDSPYEEEIDRNNTLDNLDTESQALIEKKPVIFQGIEIKLGSLVDKESKYLVAADVLCKVINGERINVDKTPCDLGEVEYYYINRIFQHRVNIKKDCFKEKNHKDVFVVSNVKDNEFSLLGDEETVCKFEDLKSLDPNGHNSVRFVILDDDENVQDNLKHLYTKYPTSNVHWVKKQGNKFIWQESHGSLSNLREFVVTEDITEYPLDKITSTGNRIVIVSAEPGMGKSVLLTKLAGKERKADPSTWVTRINLGDFTKQLNEMHFDENNLNGTINFIYKILDLKTPLERQLLKHRVENQGKIILLFDGFDEICPHYKDKVIALVKILKETKVDKLWITTRPHMRDELEDKLSVFSYSLKPLSTKDQKNFLKKFWGRKLDLKDDNDDKCLNTYIEELLKVWSLSIGDEDRDFAGIPLQTRMLAEIYHDKFEEFYNSDQSIPSFPSKLNVLHLYQSFIDKKYHIYWEEKNKVDTTNPTVNEVYKNLRSTFLLKHQLLALEMILSEQDLNLLLYKNEKKDLINFKHSVINGLERTGIINLISNKTLNFIHRTFAEYFTAFWLANNLEREEVETLLNKKLFKTKNRVLCSFFDHVLASGENNTHKNELHNAVLANDIKTIKELCLGSRNSDVDKGGRTALHLAAAYGLSEIAQVLLENNPKTIHIQDKLFGWRPLRYADKGNHWHLAELLLQGGAIGDDMSNAIAHINYANEHGSTLLHTAAEEGLYKFTELLIRSKANINATTQDNKTLLHYAATGGNLEIVKLLIEKGAAVHCKNTYGDSVLHYAAKKGNLDTVKLLIEKGADIHSRNIYGDSVLHFAAEGGNLDVVKWLIEKGADVHCQNRIGHAALHYAAEFGNLDIITLLIERGADIHCQSKMGDAVLHSAAEGGDLDVIKLLIEKGAAVHCKNTYGDSVLHYAAKKGNLDIVKWLIEKGADVHCRNIYGDTVLHSAATEGNWDVVKWLIEKGADVHCRNIYGDTVLHSAAEGGNSDMVKWLIEKGARVTCQNTMGHTVLHSAASWGNLDIVKWLISKGADINCQSKISGTVLHFAARKKNLNLVKWLIEMRADIHCRNTEGDSVLHCAAKGGELDILKILAEKGADVHCRNIYGDTVLHSAATEGNLDVVKWLIKKGADVNCQNSKGDTPLHYAAKRGNFDLVNFLVKKGADIHCRNIYGNTVLHSAAFGGNLDVVKLVIKKGADVHCQNSKGDTPLHYAAKRGNFDLVNFLVKKGADVHCQNFYRHTALHLAAFWGNLDVVKWLIEKGADVHCKNTYGDSVLHYAAKGGDLDVIKFLAEKGANVHCQNTNDDTILHYAAEWGNLDIVKWLIKKRADVHCRNIYGDTVLHSAAEGGNLDVVKWLIQKEANIHCQNSDGDTPLHYAAKRGNFDLVNFLVKKGADVHRQNFYRHTALHLAAFWGNLDVVKWLIEKGADVHCKNTYGDSVLHYAAKGGDLDVIKLLIEKGANVHCKSTYGDSVLHYAAKRGNLDIVKWLIEKGADVHCKKSDGDTVLHSAAEGGSSDMVKWLIEKGADVHCRNIYGDTVLHSAAFCGNLDVVKWLIVKGADIHCQSKINGTVLHFAARNNNLNLVKWLIEKGADIHCRNIEGDSVLHCAAKGGDLNIAKFLAEKGADIHSQNSDGDTVLHSAAFWSSLDIVRWLIEKGADVHCKKSDGDTVLHSAAFWGNLDVVKLLIKKGAYLHYQNSKGDTVLHHAAKRGNLDIVKLLIKKRADVHCQNSNGDTVLRYAARSGNWDVVKLLIEIGADVPCPNLEENTLSHLCRKMVLLFLLLKVNAKGWAQRLVRRI